MIKNFLKNKQNIYIILLIVLAVVFTIVIFHGGLLRGHDIEFHLSRIKGLRDSMKNGDFLALIHDGLYGYGYANGLFYGNLFIYLPAILSLFGLSLSKSYFIFIILCNILTPLFSYYCMKKVSKSDSISFIVSLLYSFSAYRICDVIVRAAIGEVLAFMIFPIVLLGLYYILIGDSKKWWIFSIGYILLIQAHIISSVLLAIIICALILLRIGNLIKEKERIKSLIFAGVLILTAGAFFIFPLLEQYTFSELVINNLSSEVDLSVNSIAFERIFLGLSYFKEGVFHPPGIGLILVVSCLFRYNINSNNKDLLRLSDVCMVFGIILLLMVTPIIPWKEISPIVKFIQFPWRLYMFATLFLSISSGILIDLKFKDNNKKMPFVLIYICLSLIISSLFNYCAIHRYWGVSGMEHISGYDDYYVANGEYLPYKTDINKLMERGEIVTSNNENLVIEYTKKGKNMQIKYGNNNKPNTYIEVPLLYYLGYDTNKGYVLSPGENNVIKIELKKTEDKFDIKYKGTRIQKISYVVSIVAFVLFVLCSKVRKKLI